ncbi:hypothetical protein CDAR_6601 [Caerostris darwini]|uniref:Uncharacterized protein n=1 Tax=Caerostris darwini TaxID=1538125 RepID=A0AAV4S9T7_9ARAC|nr:hypothetical protein CDAR_6601 [Caerostris darwini]
MTLCKGNSSRLQARLTNKSIICFGPRGNYWLHLLLYSFSVGWWSFAFHVESPCKKCATIRCILPDNQQQKKNFPSTYRRKDNECSEPAVEKYRMQSAKPIICLPAQIYK